MPKYSKEYEKELKAKIKKILVHKPDATISAIGDFLRMNGTNLDKDYINKILRKIRKERACRYNFELKEAAVAKFEDLIRTMDEILFRIVSGDNTPSVKIRAIKQLIRQHKDFIYLQLDTGVFSEKILNDDVSTSEILKIINEKDNHLKN